MKKTPFILSAILCVAPAMAATPIDGWYASLFGGVAYLPDNVNITLGLLTRNNSHYDLGFDAGGSLGYKSGPMRYEIEGTYISAQADRFNINGLTQTGVNGHSSAIPAMANVYYDFEGIIAPEIQPYLGVGIGYAYVNNRLSASGPLFASTYKNTNTVFAYQGKAGLTYNFAENWAGTLGYRYLATNKVRQWGKAFQAHIGNMGIVYRFDEAQYK